MSNLYKIKFIHKYPIPSRELLEYLGIQQAYPLLEMIMEVYEKKTLIYSMKLNIDCSYYCCGSTNFEINKFERCVVKECDDHIMKMIFTELKNNHMDHFIGTVLENDPIRIFEELCDF